MIILKNIYLYFINNDRYILEDINWHIRPNERWALFGRNGSGKTKLLEIIAGYHSPSRGEILRFGKPLLGSDIRDIRLRIGYVSTSLREKINRNEKAIDVVLSGLYASIGLYSKPTKNQLISAEKLLNDINLNHLSLSYFGNLSDGEKQKVLILRALINDPDLLILDEASRGLDFIAREDLLLTIKSLTTNKDISLIYVTHHTDEITDLFNKVYMLDNGKCYISANRKEALNPEVLSGLIGREVLLHEVNGRFYSILKENAL